MVHRPHVVTPAGITTLYVYDTAGEERFMSLTQNFVRRADVVVVCYDTSNKESFKDLQEVWIPFVRTNVAVEPSVFIVGTKTDLPKCEVPVETAETYARNIRAHFLTTSALDNNNVNKLFEEIDREPARVSVCVCLCAVSVSQTASLSREAAQRKRKV
nr:hypothetical protein BaRGS_015765 [Batillaria attramentaria]